jgi:cell division transport system ATP-binding protein
VGYDLAKLSEENRPYLRRKVGVVFQDFQLLSDRSVYENLNFVLRATNWKKNREMRIDEVLQKVGMEHKKHEMPHKLSGGEFQRIAIARALLNNPDVILADEPTGNLDPETTHEIISLLHHLAEAGRSVLIATHEHRLISLFKGRVLECVTGTVREITSTGEPNLNSLID